MKIISAISIAFTFLSIIVFKAQAYTPKKATSCAGENSYYVFSWSLGDNCNGKPRGGSTHGIPVTLDNKAHSGWLALREKDLTKKEQDRRAILAMAGPYKVSFDFLETVGFSKNFQRDQPYQSWGTEYVYIVENKPHFISLQHVMVMYFQGDNNTVSEPMVMKHWRQDWTYQDNEILEFTHRGKWKKRALSTKERRGMWSQAVFQVDDSPRYESIGHWQHNESFSTWLSNTTRRPLPRREFSVRSDYHVLEGFNRHTITRFGWVQEEENWKMVLEPSGKPHPTQPYLAKEEGVARYQRITNFNFTPGDQYMAATGDFWKEVRQQWEKVIASQKTLTLRKRVNGVPLYQPLFQYAQNIATEKNYDSQAGKDFVKKTIDAYVQKNSTEPKEFENILNSPY